MMGSAFIDPADPVVLEGLAKQYEDNTARGSSPSPASPLGLRLQVAYERWKKMQQAPTAAAKATAARSTSAELGEQMKLLRMTPTEQREERERQAELAAKHLKKARRHAQRAGKTLETRAVKMGDDALRQSLELGHDPGSALANGYSSYRRSGGRLDFPHWRRQQGRAKP